MKKILLIEDNPDVRENTAEILDLSGYEVMTAENGREGVKIALQHLPDLIICDIMMPVMDGYGVLKILSKNTKTTGIPFIFLTAKAEKSDFRKGMSLGADDYITKPFDDTELIDAIETRLAKTEQLNNSFSSDGAGLSSFIDEARGHNALQELSENREIRRFRKKDFIYLEGDYPKKVYFLKSGKVKIYKTNDEGREFIVGLLKPGDFFGFLPLLKGGKHHESAVTLEDAEIALVPQKDFFALIYNNRDVSSRFIKILASDLEEKEDLLIQLAYNSVRKRVSDALIQLHDRFQENEQQEFTIAILRDDLASIAGTAKETVIRTLSDFKEEGLIKVKGSKITITDLEGLQEMRN
ncbi:MAG: response regulator [Bacteroidota bacterium]